MQDLALQKPENFSPISEKRQSSATFNPSSSSPLYRAAERRGGGGGEALGAAVTPSSNFLLSRKFVKLIQLRIRSVDPELVQTYYFKEV